jgi:hypothetical protein
MNDSPADRLEPMAAVGRAGGVVGSVDAELAGAEPVLDGFDAVEGLGGAVFGRPASGLDEPQAAITDMPKLAVMTTASRLR